MSRDASITLPFADGEHVFRLRWGELIALQEACDAGPYAISMRLARGLWKVEDISHTIRLGLIGGGMEPGKALSLVQTYVEGRPPLETLALAQGILGIALMGPKDEPLGESSAASEKETV
jgi:hypothetical protein